MGSDTPKLYRFGAKVDMCFSMLVKESNSSEVLSELLSFSVSLVIRCVSFCHFSDNLYALADYLLHTVWIALGKTKCTGILAVFERTAVSGTQYGTGLFQQMFPTSENETVVT